MKRTREDAVGNVHVTHSSFIHASVTSTRMRRFSVDDASIGSNAQSLARGGVHAACARPGCVHTDASIPVPFFGDRSAAEWM